MDTPLYMDKEENGMMMGKKQKYHTKYCKWWVFQNRRIKIHTYSLNVNVWIQNT